MWDDGGSPNSIGPALVRVEPGAFNVQASCVEMS